MGEELLGANEPGIAFDVLVHGATLLAVLIYFRGRIVQLVRGRSWSYAGKILVGTIPAGIVGVLLESAIEHYETEAGAARFDKLLIEHRALLSATP